jgi:rSAM/selenodomain-associated transferase 1
VVPTPQLPRLSCALGIMAKAPQAGRVKTRLVPPLTPHEAAALSLCSLRDTAENVASTAARLGANAVAVYTPVGSEPAFEDLLPKEFSLLPQYGESLGERLFNATQRLLRLGYASVCLINSDSPTLPSDRLAGAHYALAHPGDRVVLGPARDGGYYLIGLKRAHHRLFDAIDWSTSRVLAQTLERAAEIELDVELLPEWYDVDSTADLGLLCEELFLSNGERSTRAGFDPYPAPHTREYLARLIEAEGRGRIWPAGVSLPPDGNHEA